MRAREGSSPSKAEAKRECLLPPSLGSVELGRSCSLQPSDDGHRIAALNGQAEVGRELATHCSNCLWADERSAIAEQSNEVACRLADRAIAFDTKWHEDGSDIGTESVAIVQS